jgi:hypothetical protein
MIDHGAIQREQLQFPQDEDRTAIGQAPLAAANFNFTDNIDSHDFGLNLEWPDSEALLQSLTSSDWAALALPPRSVSTTPPPPVLWPSLPQPGVAPHVDDTNKQSSHDPEQLSPDNGSKEAVRSLSYVVSNLVRLNSTYRSRALTRGT